MNNSILNLKNWLIEPLHPLSIWLKLTLIITISVVIKSTPTQPTWAVSMVLFAALFLVPSFYAGDSWNAQCIGFWQLGIVGLGFTKRLSKKN